MMLIKGQHHLSNAFNRFIESIDCDCVLWFEFQKRNQTIKRKRYQWFRWNHWIDWTINRPHWLRKRMMRLFVRSNKRIIHLQVNAFNGFNESIDCDWFYWLIAKEQSSNKTQTQSMVSLKPLNRLIDQSNRIAS